MSLINFFIRNKISSTANIAKERLKIIVSAHKPQGNLENHCLPKLKNDLLQVIRKYAYESQITAIHLNRKNDNMSILQIDIFFSDK